MKEIFQESIKFISVRDPVWVDEERTAINCIVRTNHINGEFEFTASKFDQEGHGLELYCRILSGEFGEIAQVKMENHDKFEVLTWQNIEKHEWLLSFYRYIEKTNEEVKTKSIRGIVVIWENVLSDLLVCLANEKVGKNIKPLTFARKIKEVKGLGIITEEEEFKLDAIRLVRNEVTHELNVDINSRKLNDNIDKMLSYEEMRGFNKLGNMDHMIILIYGGFCMHVAIILFNKIRS